VDVPRILSVYRIERLDRRGGRRTDAALEVAQSRVVFDEDAVVMPVLRFHDFDQGVELGSLFNAVETTIDSQFEALETGRLKPSALSPKPGA
jgi:hypothetical protein